MFEIFTDDESVRALEIELADACIVSGVKVNIGGEGEYKGSACSVTATKKSGCACERCWKFDDTVGSDAKYPNLCKRCADVVTLNFE